jgi:hypothetical protein
LSRKTDECQPLGSGGVSGYFDEESGVEYSNGGSGRGGGGVESDDDDYDGADNTDPDGGGRAES